VEVRAGKDWTGQAEGHTKKTAAQRAARGVYERLLREADEVDLPACPRAEGALPPPGEPEGPPR
jgi:hypothetical protein